MDVGGLGDQTSRQALSATVLLPQFPQKLFRLLSLLFILDHQTVTFKILAAWRDDSTVVKVLTLQSDSQYLAPLLISQSPPGVIPEHRIRSES